MVYTWQTSEVITAEKLNNLETSANNMIIVWIINDSLSGTHDQFIRVYYGDIDNYNHINGTEVLNWRNSAVSTNKGAYCYMFPVFNPEEHQNLILWSTVIPTNIEGNCEFYEEIAPPNNSNFTSTLVITGNCIITY